MLKFSETTTQLYRYMATLGALLFVIISNSAQTCVIAGHDCATVYEASAQTTDMQCHHPLSDAAQDTTPDSHIPKTPSQPDDCCPIIAAVGAFEEVHAINLVTAPSTSDAYYALFAPSFYSAAPSIPLIHREIFFFPPEPFHLFTSTDVRSRSAGRAPPFLVVA